MTANGRDLTTCEHICATCPVTLSCATVATVKGAPSHKEKHTGLKMESCSLKAVFNNNELNVNVRELIDEVADTLCATPV